MLGKFPNDARLSEFWRNGVVITDIAERLCMSEPTIRRHVKRLGLQSRSVSVPLSEADKQQMLALDAEGFGVTKIGRLLGRTHSFVSNWLGKLKNPAPSAGYAPRNGLPDAPRAGPVVDDHPSPARITEDQISDRLRGLNARIIQRTRQVEYLNRSRIKRTEIPIGPPPRTCQFCRGSRPHYDMCGAPVEPGRPYCAEHTSRCYVKLKPLMLVPREAKESFADLKW